MLAPPRASRHCRRAELGGKLPAPVIGLVIGTRPEAIKIAPVAHALAQRGAKLVLALTGQHPGLEPGDHGLDGYRAVPLGQPGLPDPIEHTERVAHALERVWRSNKPALTIVQGDTSSALGGARAAATLGIPLAHVEAGLRTHDAMLPWPEEGFRVEIDRRADLLFAPTELSAENLRAEGCRGLVYVTGNTGIDALMAELGGLKRRRRKARRSGAPLKLLVTCHRRESWGARFADIAAALIELGEANLATIDVVLHPNPRVSEAMFAQLAGQRSIRLVPPLSHGAMLAAMDEADLLLSDSGGVQEEAPTLGIPLLVLRDKTERPEALARGVMRLVGTDRARIVEEVRALAESGDLLADMAHPAPVYGDGKAARRIADLALDWLARTAEQPRASLAAD